MSSPEEATSPVPNITLQLSPSSNDESDTSSTPRKALSPNLGEQVVEPPEELLTTEEVGTENEDSDQDTTVDVKLEDHLPTADDSSQRVSETLPAKFETSDINHLAIGTAEGLVTKSMLDFYRGKSILLTGSTGFLGKSILWKLIDSFGTDIDKIYLLIRYGNSKRKIGRPHERLQSEILSNPAFTSLRRKIGPKRFDAIVASKIIPVACDLISPELSISPEDRDSIINNVNVVIHCAASMDHDERLDLSLETNTLGTLRLMDLADECEKMLAFVHVSSAYVNSNLPDGEVRELVYPADLGDPETLLKEIVSLELLDISKMSQRILSFYPNTHLFTKALTEQLILKRADINRADEAQGGKRQWPIAIIRPTQLGASVREPLSGWADGLTGANATILLSGRGFQILQPSQGDTVADIVPVDYLARIVLGIAAKIQSPGVEFSLPYAYRQTPSEKDDIVVFPYIYQVSAAPLNPVNWRVIYDGIQDYWMRTTSVVIPKSQDYFVNNKAMFKTKFFMKYQLSNSFATVAHSVVTGDNKSLNSVSKMTNFATKIVEANQPFVKRSWTFSNNNLWSIQRFLMSDPDFSIDSFGDLDWSNYIEHYNHGVHLYVAQENQGLRTIGSPPGWDCATHTKMLAFQNLAIDKQVESILFSVADIEKRSQRMLAQVIQSLESTDRQRDRKMDEEWVSDFDTSLDDWCHDDSEVLKNGTIISERGKELGRWRAHIGDNDDIVKVVVLNDRRVGESIKQITESSGVSQQTVVGEATKLFQRMKERTQLAYVWFAGHYLHLLLQKLFESVQIREHDLSNLKRSIAGKKVVYVPTSKSLVDNLIVWYVTVRYQLPVPAIACDEALGLLGPISDVLRIMGTFFIKRNPENRSPLNNAVTAAYTQVMLREHGALAFMLEKARSRSGKYQKAYDDGLVGMVLEAALERNQDNAGIELNPNSPLTPVSAEKLLDQDVVFVPINIVYENVPELSVLIDQVLDQHPTANTNTLSVPLLVTKPSAAMAGRHKDAENHHNGKYGRAFVNVGECVSVKNIAESAKAQKSVSFDTTKGLASLSERVVKAIQKGQRENVAISPVSIVAAILLYGRATNGVTLGVLKDRLEWVYSELKKRSVYVDWQEGEDIDSVIFYSLRLLDDHKNIIIDDKRVSDKSIIRIVDHADNVLTLSYSANQLLGYLLPDSLFSIVYLSFASKTVSRETLFERFQFLSKLFRLEFDFSWEDEQMFDLLLDRFQNKDIINSIADQKDCYNRVVLPESDATEHDKICFLASLLYPTLDSYWITICSLSALEDLPYIPRKLAPILTQWIATHLISGRRTFYREVLSTEISSYAVDAFLAMGYINQVHCKEKLTPDAQILLLELGIVTNEDLLTAATIEDSSVDTTSEIESLPISDAQQEILKAEKDELANMAAKVERLSKISKLCNDIELLRYDAASHSESYHQNAQVFLKCQRQIKSILRADQSYAAQHGVPLSKEEDDMIQLVYALKMSSPSGGSHSKQSRRISEVYNLHP